MSMMISPYRFGGGEGGGGSDPNFANVVLLCGFEGADGSTSFTDESSFAHALTGTGSAQIDTAQFKFGASSALFNGTSTITAADSDDWSFGSGQFTLETWIRFNTLPAQHDILSHRGVSGQREWQWIWTSGSGLQFGYSVTGNTVTTLSAAWSPSTGTWYHVAVDRDASNNIRQYVDGSIIGGPTAAAVTFFNSNANLQIANALGSPLNGWMDEVRITKGVARYAGSFTSPSSAFPRS